MATDVATEEKPLWLFIEECIFEQAAEKLSGENQENTIQQIAVELDNAGYNVTHHAGNMLQLRWAVQDRLNIGKPFMEDFNNALAALTLAEVTDPYSAAVGLINDIGVAWPKLKRSERKGDVLKIVEKTKLDLLIAKAKNLSGDEGIRLLIEESIASEVITEALEITGEKFSEVNAAVEKERAERNRVEELLETVADKPEDEKVKHLISNNVSDELIIELGSVDQGAVDAVKKEMEAELKEKQRLEEEAAAEKKAAAAGPSLEDIPSDQILEYIEALREILEFCDEEKEIRVMCEQSAIPTSLVDIAVLGADKLDELEKKTEG